MATTTISQKQLSKETITVNSGGYGRASLGFYENGSPVVSAVCKTLVNNNFVIVNLAIYNGVYWGIFTMQDGSVPLNADLELIVIHGKSTTI